MTRQNEAQPAGFTRVFSSSYKDIPAVTLESDRLSVRFAPNYGGKMLSLVDRRTSREFLRQAEGASYKILAYDGDYVAAECSGFDDMFPTIDRFACPAYPWKGVEMPDHGEVCGLKWACETLPDGVRMAVNGVRFPYRLEKEIRFCADDTLLIKYLAKNLSQFDLDFLWAGHIMIDAGESGEISMPFRDSRNARVVISGETAVGRYGDMITWPATTDRDGRSRPINKVEPTDSRFDILKYYFADKLPEGWCEYRYDDDGTRLTLSFPAETVPYFGILISRGYGLILEPCTATMDRPDLARIFGQSSVLPACGEYGWYLKIQVS